MEWNEQNLFRVDLHHEIGKVESNHSVHTLLPNEAEKGHFQQTHLFRHRLSVVLLLLNDHSKEGIELVCKKWSYFICSDM